ncbi:MAG: 2-oxoacid:acceptor oxidoreductase family protein, partial [Deltaproteobacteria bacterium]|nr:2-oxoacid:acceptor oxidoreductase family protein [Deltaproteobacteria bacterium]
MSSLLNRQRPPIFCPGCSHEKVVKALDMALQRQGLQGNQVVIVTDIGCSGLFDTFFNTHALHGLHGRALTYATGLKMARPELHVIVIMGDGGLGIGGAHVISSCRRNLDISLLVLNNFNYGMTGGQCSFTTPVEAATASGFLNQLETPLDICRVGSAAGASYTDRVLATSKELPTRIQQALEYPGFSLMDIWGICPGRYGKRNKELLKHLQKEITRRPLANGRIPANERAEFGSHYRKHAAELQLPASLKTIAHNYHSSIQGRYEILLLGAAGQRINTAGELLCLSAMTAGLHVTQKNDFPITVLRGYSISEIILSRHPIGYTAIENPDVVIALSQEGISRRKQAINLLGEETLLIVKNGLALPENNAEIIEIDFKNLSVPSAHWALASLAVLAREKDTITKDMLQAGLANKFSGK